MIFFHNDIRVDVEEVPVVKGNVPDNAKAVGNDAKFIGIAEMAVDIHLRDLPRHKKAVYSLKSLWNFPRRNFQVGKRNKCKYYFGCGIIFAK